jgi:flagellar basal body rod protein FlgG
LNSPTGIVFSRNGSVQVSAANQLATAEGYTLRNTRNNGQPIAVDPLRPIEIDRTGVVKQNGQEIGQIEIGGFGNATAELSKLGTGYFAQLDPAKPAGSAPETLIKQGSIEQSNVPVTDGAVRLISVMRQFEMLQRAMSVGAEMNKRAIDEVARAS